MSGKPWEILQGDVRKVLKTLPPDHFDGVLSDPPYGMAFMGRRWDYYLPSVNVWTELLRVLKPGAHGMLFGGSRTSHRLAVGVEDAGFELRDTLMWMYGSGFPKSHDVSKAIDKDAGAQRRVIGKGVSGKTAISIWADGGMGDFNVTAPATTAAKQWNGWGTALKPAHEPIILCRKFFEGTVAQNVQRWGVGALAIDGCRVGVDGGTKGTNYAKTGLFGMGGRADIESIGKGRWPANVMLDEEAAAQLDAQSGFSVSLRSSRGELGAGPFSGIENSGRIAGTDAVRGHSDTGGASRFFYTAKASKAERGKDNKHPTVKPLDLIRYLARLILPPRRRGKPRRILVPYAGSGSEIIGCLQAGWDEVVGIEREVEYIQMAEVRIRKGGVFSKLLRTKRRQATP